MIMVNTIATYCNNNKNNNITFTTIDNKPKTTTRRNKIHQSFISTTATIINITISCEILPLIAVILIQLD